MNKGPDTLIKTFAVNKNTPVPGSQDEKEIFNNIQLGFRQQFEKIFPDKLAPRTVVIIPSFSLDEEILSRIKGHIYYEERLLCLLMLLRMPLTKVIYVTSIPVDNVIIDYYLHLLPGITGIHARQRLTMLSCYDTSSKALTKKILERPRLIHRIRQDITNINEAHLTCFNITNLEKTLAVRLGIPLFGTDPDLFYEGTKSGGRKTFKDSGVRVPDGFEDLKTRQEIAKAITSLKIKTPGLRKAVVKMNEGFSGEGNAVYYYPDNYTGVLTEQDIDESMATRLKILAEDLSEITFFQKISEMGGIVEEFIDADIKMSPSVQCLITPFGIAEVLSTHDQVLGGEDGQIFVGASFPANNEYSISLAKEGKKIAQTLANKGALGRFAIDFISVKKDSEWIHYAIEINLRKGGTTHPYFMLQFLTDGTYNAEKGEYLTASGNKRFYFSTDNLCKESYKGLTPQDLIDIAIFHSLMYDGASQEGVMFHLVGALSQYGKLGLVCIGDTAEKAKEYYDKVIYVLYKESES